MMMKYLQCNPRLTVMFLRFKTNDSLAKWWHITRHFWSHEQCAVQTLYCNTGTDLYE